jgi:hypothetical protein
MRLGHGQRRAVVIMWLWTALLSGFVLYPVYTGKGDAVVPVLAGAMGLILLTWFHPGVRQARETNGHIDLLDAAPTTNGSTNGRQAAAATTATGTNGAAEAGEVRTAVPAAAPDETSASRPRGSAPPGRHSKKGRRART